MIGLSERWVKPEYAEANIGNGWLIQYRGGRNFVSNAIRWAASGSPHTHSSMAYVRTSNGQRIVEILEMREFKGGLIKPLKDHTFRFDGRMDVFSIDTQRFPEYDFDEAVRCMIELTTRRYGYRGVIKILARKIPFLWRLVPVDISDVLTREEADGVRPFCSMAVAIANQLGGGVDPVLRLPHYLVEPAHLTQSHLYKYEFSIRGGE
jgi:hypothetical protein